MSPTVASDVNNLMLEVTRRLNLSLVEVRKHSSDEEFGTYRRAVGVILSDILFEVLNPLYKEHPSLKPKEMD